MASKKKSRKMGYAPSDWMLIVGCCFCFVTSDGRVWYDVYKNKPCREVPQYLNNKGYLTVNINRAGFTKRLKVHRLVAIAFIDNPENKPEVNHIDGDKLNCKKSNLEWATRKENAIHASENGLMMSQVGELQGGHKLKNKDIPTIRSSEKTDSELARIFNVSRRTISNVRSFKSWSHL